MLPHAVVRTLRPLVVGGFRGISPSCTSGAYTNIILMEYYPAQHGQGMPRLLIKKIIHTHDNKC